MRRRCSQQSARNHHLSDPQAIVVGFLHGVTELFPVSTLGHSMLVPAVVRGRWARQDIRTELDHVS